MEIFKCWNSQMRKYLSYDIRCFFYYIKLLLFLLTILFFVQGAVFEFGQVSPAILTHIMRIKISNGQIFWYLGLHYTSHPRSWHVTLWLYYTSREKLVVSDVTKSPYMDIQFISIYGKFVTSLSAYYSCEDIILYYTYKTFAKSRRSVALWLYHVNCKVINCYLLPNMVWSQCYCPHTFREY